MLCRVAAVKNLPALIFSADYLYAPNFEKVGDILVLACPYVCMYVGMVWYGMVWYGMVWYGMVWYGMEWYRIVSYRIVSYRIVS